MKRLAILVVALAGCAADPAPGPAAPAADRVADFTPLRLGQPWLGGALEVTRLRQDRAKGDLRVIVGVTNRSGSDLRLRWRFRFVDAEGWEVRSRESAVWREATIGAGEEWVRESDEEIAGATAIGMDWRHER
jgi:hypothetical protein